MDLQQQLFAAALKIESPLFIENVMFHSGVLHIYIGYDKNAQFDCPICGEKHDVYDSIARTWRHLNFFQYKC